MDEEIKVVCFNLSDEEYALNVDHVLGVNPVMKITRVPGVPDFVEGVIKIKGHVIPLIDLRRRFGMEGLERGKKSRIIITRTGEMRIGIIVDNVTGVISAGLQQIEPPSGILNRAKFLKGVVNIGGRLLLMLDMDKLISQEENRTLADIHKNTATK